MEISTKIKAITLSVSSVLMAGAGQTAFAHASILNAITSGATGFSRVGINHANNNTTPPTPIIAQSVVFPTVNPIINRIPVGTVLPLGAYFSTSAAGAATSGLAPFTTIAGAPQLVQSRDVFNVQIEQADASNRTIGWVSSKGSLQVNLHGEVPFRFAAPHFRSVLPSPVPAGMTTADLCVSALSIQVAVADIANPNPQPPFVAANPAGPTGSETTGIGFNLWIDNNTPGLAGSAFPPQFTENSAGTPKLLINRDTTLNPYPANCAPAGGADPVFTVTVFPSAADINALQFPGWGTLAPGNTLR